MKQRLAFVLAAACALGAGAAHAGQVHWSIGINAPPVATVISNGPGYGSVYGPAYGPAYGYGPSYYAPPVVYAPPRYRHRHHHHYRAPVVVVPPPVFYGPAPVVHGGWRHPHPQWRGRPGHRDEYGTRYNDRRWAPVPRDPRRQPH